MSMTDDVLTFAEDGRHADLEQAEGARAPGLPPLAISALMVTKADLIAALRVYLPQLSDIQVIDGERFLLSVVEPTVEHGSD
jgi:hypothetical protein